MEGVPLRKLHTPMVQDPARPLDQEEYHDDGPDDLQEENEGYQSLTGDAQVAPVKNASTRLFAAFLLFGLLNNVLYVIILSAALDLVPATTPKGVIAFFNVFPALVMKVAWPLISRGTIRYTRRLYVCTTCSWLGIVIIAISSGVPPRLFGISMASFSSGLGELTFLQLTTTLPSSASNRTALGAWSSGTGLAGVGGAGIWWLLRGLGVKEGLGISSLLPLFFPLTYFLLLPPFSAFESDTQAAYQPVPTNGDSGNLSPSAVVPTLSLLNGSARPLKGKRIYLNASDKMTLLKPLVLRYMLSLCLVYIEEYTINSGVGPTLVFPLPTSGLWARLFKSPRDYYPFWSLTYQTFVFLSRSSLSFGLPALPRRLLPVPTLLQFFVLCTLALQSSRFIFSTSAYTPPAIPPDTGVDRSITFVFLLICLEGLCGGCAYVNTFYHVGREGEEGGEGEEGARRKMEKEFRIGAVGAADSSGILVASLISMPLEVALCSAQVNKGRATCREL